MRRVKKILGIVILCCLGVIDILIYWNTRLVDRAQGKDDSETKIQILEKAARMYPWNDHMYYEMGKAYFAFSVQNLVQGSEGASLVSNAADSFRRSLRINPANPFGHFYYAQSLWFEDLLSPTPTYRFNKELKSAAKLAGENRELLFEVGKKLLTCWRDLGEEDRNFVLTILKKTLEREPEEKFDRLMRIWEMNVRDVGVLEKIMPEDPDVFRAFGAFLGEKEFPLRDRHSMLSRADYLQFKLAERLLESGKKEYASSRFGKAKKLLSFSLGSLYKIRFFHKLSGQYAFADSDFRYLFKSVNYYLFHAMIETGEGWEDILEYVHKFLELEDDKQVLQGLESYLQKRGAMDDSIRIHLYSKMGRYQEIGNIGARWLEESHEVPGLNSEDSGRMLRLLGEAYHVLGKLREAALFYEKLLQIDPENLQVLKKIRQIYQDLGEEENILEVDKRIIRIEGPRERVFSDWIISKGEPFSQRWNSGGAASLLELHFQPVYENARSLVTIEWNREVVWDDYLDGPTISLEIQSTVGANTLRIIANTYPFAITKIVFRPRIMSSFMEGGGADIISRGDESNQKFTP